MIGDILSDKAARAAVMGVLARTEGVGVLGGILQNERGLPLRQAVAMVGGPAPLITALSRALAGLPRPAGTGG